MVRAEVVRKRLNKLDEYRLALHGMQKYSFEAFVRNPEYYGSSERFLQLAIDTKIDIGATRSPSWYWVWRTGRATSGHLGRGEYLDDELRETWVNMIGSGTSLYTSERTLITGSCTKYFNIAWEI